MSRSSNIDRKCVGKSMEILQMSRECPEYVSRVYAVSSTDHVAMTPTIQQDMYALDSDREVNIKCIITDWKLNADQLRAFNIITQHSLEKHPKQLQMFLSGPAGTGKTRVINTLKDFFTQHGQSRQFRLASYMGVAA